MNFNNPVDSVLIIIAVIGLLVYRQIHPRRLSTRGLILMPIIILYFVLNDWHTFHPNNKEIIDIVVSAIVSIVLGLLACRELKVYPSPHTGKAMSRGSWKYFLFWLAAFIIKIILAIALGETKNINQVEILVPLFLLVTTRSAYLYWKVTRLGLELHQHHE